MKTRSQTQNTVLYEVNIDFDEASKAWRQNKKHLGNCQYKYVCPYEKKDGAPCGKACYKQSQYCWTHTR